MIRRIVFSPRCFKCRLDIESGPVAVEFLRVLMASKVMLVVNRGRRVWFNWSFLSFFLFSCYRGGLVFERCWHSV